MNPSRRRCLRAALLAPWGRTAFAHELQENRLTIVQRDGRHISLSFHLDIAGVLQRVWLPQATVPAAVLSLAAMKPDDFRQRLLQVQGRVERGTWLAAGGRDLALTNWQWPDAARVQALLQQRGMQAVVTPQDHAHDGAVEVRAEAVSEREAGELKVRLPTELQRVLVVCYKPRQGWVAPGEIATLKF